MAAAKSRDRRPIAKVESILHPPSPASPLPLGLRSKALRPDASDLLASTSPVTRVRPRLPTASHQNAVPFGQHQAAVPRASVLQPAATYKQLAKPSFSAVVSSVWVALMRLFLLGGLLSTILNSAGSLVEKSLESLSIRRARSCSNSSNTETEANDENQLWLRAQDELDAATRELQEIEHSLYCSQNRVALAHSKVKHMRASRISDQSTTSSGSESKRNAMVHAWCVSGRFA